MSSTVTEPSLCFWRKHNTKSLHKQKTLLNRKDTRQCYVSRCSYINRRRELFTIIPLETVKEESSENKPRAKVKNHNFL